MRRTEVRRLLELLRIEIDRADLPCAGDARALDHGQADGAAPDHADARALPDARHLEHAHDAGRDGAADQARLLDRELGRDLHRRDGWDDGARRERPGTQDR